jgi:hypothetical protein
MSSGVNRWDVDRIGYLRWSVGLVNLLGLGRFGS